MEKCAYFLELQNATNRRKALQQNQDSLQLTNTLLYEN